MVDKYGIENAKIFPISSEEALIIRKLQLGKQLSKKEKRKVSSIEDAVDNDEWAYTYFEQYAPLSNFDKNKINNSIQEAKKNNDWKKQALHHSGITALEMVIDDYVNKYAIPIKVKEAFKEIDNMVLVSELEAKLIGKMRKNKKELAEYEKNLERIGDELSKGSLIKDFKKKINEIKIDKVPIKKERAKINTKFIELYKSDIFTDSLDILKAKRQIEMSIKKIEDLKINIETNLEKQLNKSIKKESEKIIDEFKKEIEKLFGKNKDLNDLGINDKKVVLSSLLTSKDLIDKSQTKKVKTVNMGSEQVARKRRRRKDKYDSWSFLKVGKLRGDFEEYTITVNKTKNVTTQVSDPVKIKKYFQDISNKLQNDVGNYEEIADDELNILKSDAIQIATSYDTLLKERIDEKRGLINDTEALKNKEKQYKQEKQWLDNYKSQKDSIYKTIKD